MPLVKIQELEPDVKLALWRVEETPEEMMDKYSCLSSFKSDAEVFKSGARKMEYLVERALLHSLLNKDIDILHEESGKPYLDGENGLEISISHTLRKGKGFVAIVLSRHGRSGIDIEYQSDRINKIVDKFIREDEKASTTIERLIIWSAKETVYKYFHEQDLQYFEMRCLPFVPMDKGTVVVENLKGGGDLTVGFILDNEYILTYAVNVMQK